MPVRDVNKRLANVRAVQQTLSSSTAFLQAAAVPVTLTRSAGSTSASSSAFEGSPTDWYEREPGNWT